MKNRTWKYAVSPVLLTLVLLAGLWYYRPVTFHILDPALRPAVIRVTLIRSGSAPDSQSRTLEADVSTEQGRTLLSRLEGLRFRRPPTNLLFHPLSPTAGGRQAAQGEYRMLIRLSGGDGDWVSLQFSDGRWAYGTSRQPQFLPCHVPDGRAAGQALGDILWEIAAPRESAS
ncbi:hypothetical protein [uncultured Oscillibacter sp.]|uniref:hypothetical protein n=1 Tax=uncultured Oscillibacter sp. TaxID=876091 RepID=UPI0025FD802D|nr:hypothetical protein [uncultured Oscillibacter sp.]